MKPLVAKYLVLVPLVIFADYLIMLALGCTACLTGAVSKVSCSSFCLLGLGIVVLSLAGLGVMLLRDLGYKL